MPIVFAHSARLRLRTATYFGVIDDNTLLRAYRALANGYDPSLNDIIDLTGVTSVLIGDDALNEVAELFAHAPRPGSAARLAVVALTEPAGDVTRLLRGLHPGAEVYVCRSLVEAHPWLNGE